MSRVAPTIASLAALIFAATAWAQQPRQLEPLPEPPPPPPGLELDPALEPQVTITKKGEDTVEEYRVNGRLYKIRVTPARGEPYLLIDPTGEGSFVRQEGPGNPGLSVPQWVIGTF